MGGGGYFYDRDVTSTSRRTASGFSDVAQEALSRSRVDKAILPNRKVKCTAKNPIVYAFDVTGSMGQLPKIIYDKMPMIAGQIKQNKYMEDPEMSLAAVGDIFSDKASIQVCNFSKLRSLDEWLGRLWLEGGGGPGSKESYEMTAYFYANMCEMPNAENPIFLFTADEGFYENLVSSDLEAHFGGKRQDTDAYAVFKNLRKNFKDNVFLIHRRYSALDDAWIVKQWKRALGDANVVLLSEDLAIADITLGVVALASRSRTLDEYVEDMKTRPLDLGGEKFAPQSPERIKVVRGALEELAEYLAVSRKDMRNKRATEKPVGKKDTGRKNFDRKLPKPDEGTTL